MVSSDHDRIGYATGIISRAHYYWVRGVAKSFTPCFNETFARKNKKVQ